jgi:hypothetical protein
MRESFSMKEIGENGEAVMFDIETTSNICGKDGLKSLNS